jgi:hypothetical protein
MQRISLVEQGEAMRRKGEAGERQSREQPREGKARIDNERALQG